MTEDKAAYVTPGHPVLAGAGYDCTCGECEAVRAGHAPAHPLFCTCWDCVEADDE